MIKVYLNGDSYEFPNYQKAREFQYENGGKIISQSHQQYDHEEPQRQLRQRRPKPKSIIPKAPPYQPFHQQLFNPKTSKKLYDK